MTANHLKRSRRALVKLVDERLDRLGDDVVCRLRACHRAAGSGLRDFQTAIFRADIVFRVVTSPNMSAAARREKVSLVSIWRWRRAWQRSGFLGLLPKHSPGRPPNKGGTNG